jgi:hypothetical protein
MKIVTDIAFFILEEIPINILLSNSAKKMSKGNSHEDI